MNASANETNVSRREQRRQHQQGLGRTQLLDAAEEVFGRKGFHEATLKEVAELAEFSVGSVYSFFESKDDLFRQIFLRRGDQFMDGMRAVLTSDASPVEQLRSLVEFQVGFFREHPHFARLTLRYSSTATLALGEAVDEAIAANYAEAVQLQTALIERGQRAKQFRAGDPEVLGGLVSGLVWAYQALDPAVVSPSSSAGARLSLDELHDVVRAAFAR